jgi:hypothetical protein
MIVSGSVGGLSATNHRASGRNRIETIDTQASNVTASSPACTASAVDAPSPSSPIIIRNT